MSDKKTTFPEILLQWHSNNSRHLPWKIDKDPYKIWLSEIILQQTRVNQGIPYYKDFIKRFPDLDTLASASEDEVFQVWKGLGYYSRARNLHHTAKFIHNNLDGVFPDTYEALLGLKGIGPYTAAAIASFAFDKRKAVVDGNVIRVLSRVFGIDTPFDKAEGKKIFNSIAQELIPGQAPADYNQAIMDFGALQCTPKNPDCGNCPLSKICYARQNKVVQSLPTKSKKIIKKNRYFIFFNIISADKQVVIQKRLEKDIWQGLYQFPIVEVDKNSFTDESSSLIPAELLPYINHPVITNVTQGKQILTHQVIHGNFYSISVNKITGKLPGNFFLVDYENLCNFAFPKIIDWFIEEN